MIDGIGGLPAAASSLGTSPKAGGAMGKQEFLQLLVSQLKNQDPLNPMEPDAFAAQLAQFSTVEQLVDANVKLDAQAASLQALSGATNHGAALAAVGKDVVAVGDEVAIGSPGVDSVTIDAGGVAASGVLEIYQDGRLVGSRALGPLSAGRQRIAIGDAATDLPAGKYTYKVALENGDGGAVNVLTYTTGRIDGVRFGSTGPVLIAGPLTIPLGNVAEIQTPRTQESAP